MIQAHVRSSRLRSRLPIPLAVVVLGGLLAACSSTGAGDGLEETAASVGANVGAGAGEANFASMGQPAPYCPNVEVREGTNVLQRSAGAGLAYNASILGANATCRIVDNQLRMKVDIGGRIEPGPGGPGAVQLPIRVAVLRGDDVIYSELGQASTSAPAGGAAQSFTYSDPRIAFAVPSDQNIRVFTGFDEGPPE